MKISYHLLFFGWLIISVNTAAQTKLSPEQEAFFNKLITGINTRHVNWVRTTAAEVKAKNLTEDDIKRQAERYAAPGISDKQDIEALVGLVMILCAKDQEEDLKKMLNQLKTLNEQKTKQRELISKLQQQRTMTAIQLDSFKLLSSRTIALQQGRNPDSIKIVRTTSRVKAISKAEMDTMVAKLKSDLDSMSEMGEMESLRLQMAMDRMSKMMSTLSNILKKISKTAEEITQNLK